MTSASKTLARLEQQAQQRQTPAQLPLWPDSKRALPRDMVRCALFPSLPRGPRAFVRDLEVFSVAGFSVRFTGERFDQSDLTVWLEIVNAIKGQPDNQQATFTAHGLLKTLGKATGGKDRAWLHSVIIRLTEGTVKISAENRRYWGHLIESGDTDDTTGRYNLSLNARFVRFFRAGWSSLDIEQRRTLASPSAQALHAWLSSHTQPPKRHRWETLAGIAGISGANARKTLRTALNQLRTVGFLTAWNENGDGVEVQITPPIVDNPTG